MQVQESNDQRLVLSEKDGELSLIYVFIAVLIIGFAIPIHLWGELNWLAYLGYLLAIWVLVVALLSRNSWHRLILDRSADQVVYTRKLAIRRRSETMPLSAVHSIVVKEREIRVENGKSTVYRVVIRPFEGSGHYAIGFLMSRQGGNAVAQRCNEWLGTDTASTSA
ncbi:cytochrome b-245 chaperone 1/Eros family protein [Nioella aestuarii]|uniref:cytochrome b-245 chaperone 1/Eros family protein n=1 Tax=Nioella aestuarii TaxID=1662864 RepID=UPI003D7FABF3